MEVSLMKKFFVFFSVILVLLVLVIQWGCTKEMNKNSFSLDNLDTGYLSNEAKELLKQNGFVVTSGYTDEIFEIYSNCKKHNEPVFVTTDAVLHTSHIFFDYILRILEIEKLFNLVNKLTDKMLELSIKQYDEAENSDVKEAARLNIGFFSVAKKLLNPDYRVDYQLEEPVEKELSNIEKHEGIKFRELLTYIKNPNLFTTPYAYEDYTQYIPRGHYTRSDEFKKYFKVMMWYGRMDFKLKPGKSASAISDGKKMTLQAILMVDAFIGDAEALKLWKMIYEPTVYFVGKTDDFNVDDYIKLIKEIFPKEGTVDKYGDEGKLSKFIDKAINLKSPQILGGAASVAERERATLTKSFRFMGQRFIPDSYILQELVYGVKNGKEILKYTGKGKPFTMEEIPNVGPARAFPRGLDVLGVLASERALTILKNDGDTEYTNYYEQIDKLRKEVLAKTTEDWKQNLYWQWLYSLLPLLKENIEEEAPLFMQSIAWVDKELQTSLGSWAELRHDTILYAKQSYTMLKASVTLPLQPQLTYGYVEPYPEVYARIEEMMRDLRGNLVTLGVAEKEIPEKLVEFEDLLEKLKIISEKELKKQELSDEEYNLIWNIGEKLASLKNFSYQIMQKITSGTDLKIDIIADVHTDINTGQVLEEGVGSPFNIYVIVDDRKGYRLCHGGVFSYYEFKQKINERLTDEKWQEMQKNRKRPKQANWIKSFTAE